MVEPENYNIKIGDTRETYSIDSMSDPTQNFH